MVHEGSESRWKQGETIKTMKKILVVANDFPYPPNHGAALDIWTRLCALKRMGYQVDLVASTRYQPSPEELRAVREVVNQVWTTPRELGWRAVASILPYQVRSRRSLRDVRVPGRYDAVLLEAEHVAAFLENPVCSGTPIILRVHNNEARFFRELSRGNATLTKRLFYLAESLKFALFSTPFRKRCKALWFISDYERTEHAARFRSDESKCFFLPPHVDQRSLKLSHSEGEEVLFIGTLTIPHNADGVLWYIKEVHPLLADIEGYRLRIAGHTAGSSIGALENAVTHAHGVTLLKNPEDLDALYAAGSVFVNPVLRGAGLKLKTIHALQAGLPVVTTSIGMEGTGLIDTKHVLVADSAAEFAECVRRLMQDKELGRELVAAAQDFLAAQYDSEVRLKVLLDWQGLSNAQEETSRV